MMDITLILTYKYPNDEWYLDGEEYDGLVWLSDTPKPTEHELEILWPDVRFQLEYETVSKSRAMAYAAPGGSDGIFFKWQRGEATEQEWLDAVQAINDAYPYPVK